MIQIQTLLASFPQTPRTQEQKWNALTSWNPHSPSVRKSERQGLQLAKEFPFLLFSEKHGLLL